MAPILLCLWMVSRLKLMKKKMNSEDDKTQFGFLICTYRTTALQKHGFNDFLLKKMNSSSYSAIMTSSASVWASL